MTATLQKAVNATNVSIVDENELATGIERIQAEMAVLFKRARVYFRDAARDVHPDLQPSAYAILVRLVLEGPMRGSTLVDYFATDKGAISRQIAQLEKLGFVTRTPDPDDKRAHLVAATPEGRARCEAARERHTRVTRESLAHWDSAEIATLGDLLNKFNAIHQTPPD